MSEEKNKDKPGPTLHFEKADNFISIYSNSVYLEPNAWDLKIIFGQLDQKPDGTAFARQQIAITVPWAQAKLALYYLRLQVEATEIQSGKIGIRKDLIPPEPTPPSPEQISGPNALDAWAIFTLIQKVRAEFLSTL